MRAQMRRGGPGGPPRAVKPCVRRLLPGAAGLAAAVAGGGAGTGGRSAEGLRDREDVGGLRRRRDVVARRCARGDDDGPADVETRGPELSGGQARAVVLRISEARLDLGDGVTSVGL